MGATAIEPRTTFDPPDEKLPAVLEILKRPDFTLEMCADEFQVTLPALCAFLTSDRGLLLLAHTELAQAIHIRAIAIAQLPRVIDAMTYALEDFANTCRNVPINPRSMPALEFVERAKDTARRNGQLLLRLAHFTPRPLRAYSHPPHSPSQREGAGGRASSTSNPATATQPTPAPQALTSPERERVGPASTNPTRKRGATDASIAHPISDHQMLPSPSPVFTSPERERAGRLPTSDIPHPKSDIAPLTPLPAQREMGAEVAESARPEWRALKPPQFPVPLTISAGPAPSPKLQRPHFPTSDFHNSASEIPHRPQTVPP